MIHPRTSETNRTAYVNHFFNERGTFLDFGGNGGNLLHYGINCADEKTYTCLDVSKVSIEAGKAEFPRAAWVYYDRYNWMYNHAGDFEINLPDIDEHDYIFAYSVFSHTDLWELVTTLRWMMRRARKKIVVSVLDINNDVLLSYFFQKRVDEFKESIDIREWKDQHHSAYLFDSDEVSINEYKAGKRNSKTMIAMYDLDYLQEFLINNGIRCTIEYTGCGPIPFVVVDL